MNLKILFKTHAKVIQKISFFSKVDSSNLNFEKTIFMNKCNNYMLDHGLLNLFYLIGLYSLNWIIYFYLTWVKFRKNKI